MNSVENYHLNKDLCKILL